MITIHGTLSFAEYSQCQQILLDPHLRSKQQSLRKSTSCWPCNRSLIHISFNKADKKHIKLVPDAIIATEFGIIIIVQNYHFVCWSDSPLFFQNLNNLQRWTHSKILKYKLRAFNYSTFSHNTNVAFLW